MKRIAIIAALSGELESLVRAWPAASRNGVKLWQNSRGRARLLAACAGMGAKAAERALAAVEADGLVDAVVSTGWAGALSETFVAGRAYRVSEVIDAVSGECFAAVGGSGGRLVSAPKVADEAEKRRLAAVYRAGLVDMEAAAMARVAAARGIPFFCIKGVSDGVSDRLPDFNLFLSAEGQLRRTRLIFFSALRPRYWTGLVRMGVNSRKAAEEIRKFLFDALEDSLR